jgi:hypothetical protein
MITGTNAAGPRRRAVLAVPAVAALLGGCSDGAVEKAGVTTRKAPASTSPEVRLRAQAARDSVALLAKYDTVIAAYPALAGGLGPLRAEVARHAQAFGAKPAAGTVAPTPAPAGKRAALAALASAEQSLADARTTALLDAPAELARLLASVAAAGACHVLLLKEG